MRKEDLALASDIKQKLTDFNKYIPLPGISNPQNLACLVEQIIDSTRRIKYVTLIKSKTYSSTITDPSQIYFNPLKAAIWHRDQGDTDEAFWLVFLFVHFGKHHIDNWALIRAIYGSLSLGHIWDWKTINSNPGDFKIWLSQNQQRVKEEGRFGNHRKYETLDAHHPMGTAEILLSYIKWISQYQTHSQMIQNAVIQVGNDPKRLFAYLYKSMSNVIRFGRTAKFDYLTMIGKLELANLEPGSAYISEATGPRRGAKLLFGDHINAKQLETHLRDLNEYLNLYFGWQVLEDSLCNWQKSPDHYIHFKG